jgi:hypothetical protein
MPVKRKKEQVGAGIRGKVSVCDAGLTPVEEK